MISERRSGWIAGIRRTHAYVINLSRCVVRLAEMPNGETTAAAVAAAAAPNRGKKNAQQAEEK